MIRPRGTAPAVAPSLYDIPILLKRGLVPGRGPRVEYQFKRERAGVFDEEEQKNAGADQATMKWVAEVLHSHYRGHFFAVHVDSKQGICLITIPVLLGNWKYVIHLDKLDTAFVIKAGGEILERFNIPRSTLDLAAFVDARPRRVERFNQKPPGGL